MREEDGPYSDMNLRLPVKLLCDRRSWLAGVVIAIVVAAHAFGLNDYLSIATLAENRTLLMGFVGGHMAIAILTFIAVYIGLVAFSLPGSQILTIAGGFLFGTVLGAALSVVGATAGAILIFIAVTRIFGPLSLSRLGRRVETIAQAIRSEAWSYLFVLRLLPIAPFFAVNLAAALVGIKLRTFAFTTFFGIIPGALAYAMCGAGIGTMFEAGHVPDLTDLLSPQIMLAMGALAALALAAIPMKRYIERRKAERIGSDIA